MTVDPLFRIIRTIRMRHRFLSHRVTSRSEPETERIAARFARTLRGGEVILLDGDLGAGKTVFVRGLARGLGITERITSPTFVLMRIHRVESRESKVVSSVRADRALTPHASRLTTFIHVDAYRIRDSRELEAIGLLEYVEQPDTVVAIEWGSRVSSQWRRRAYRVTLTSTTPHHRTITIVCPPSNRPIPRGEPGGRRGTIRHQPRQKFKR
ncbi:tRNA (adenosine(37)-N6)-threonylcarbamoyltransferase complex ATPase subunit type 1 TsaE [Candidatus Uhrbacteria bacterium]|nr:tRNA (adenosine(37)-N6)-threonylcarbamoyltransferase complex ATPase subunit type 1 TsaE [Candidatus Uhrbacteria bacterium]